MTEALLDVFKRQFFTDAGRPTKPQNASHFSVQVRYLKCQEHALLKLSGQHGLYVEPRTPDASVPSEEYQVVWLPQASFSAAQHQSQCEPMSVGLARSGNRYGIRIPSAHFQQVFQKLKPEGLFLAPGTRQSWLCGPWPYGSDRKSIAKVFQGWPWQARPIQPAKAITGGVLWLVQSVVDPPQTVYNLPHGQVMISKCDSAKEGTTESGSVVGPQSTVEALCYFQHCRPLAYQGSLAAGTVQGANTCRAQCCAQCRSKLAGNGGPCDEVHTPAIAPGSHGSGRYL